MHTAPHFAQDLGVLIWVLIFCFGIFLAALWTALPFAVFGIKSRLNDVNGRLQEVINRLGRIADLLVESQDPTAARGSEPKKPEGDVPPWSGFSGPS